MPVVTKTLRDGNGETFIMRFWQAGDGSLSPLHAVSAAAGESLPVQLSGRSAVVISSATYYAEGGTIYGLAASLPDAVAAHAVLPFGFYYAVDTKVVYGNTGAAWVQQ